MSKNGGSNAALASILVSIPYSHYYLTRADFEHFGVVAPLFLMVIASSPFFIAQRRRNIAQVSIIATTFIIMFPIISISPLYQEIASGDKNLTTEKIGKDEIVLFNGDAQLIRFLKYIKSNYIHDDEKMIIAPYFPGAYPLLEQKSPIWDIYFLLPATESHQKELIMELNENNVNYAFLADTECIGPNPARLRNTYSFLWAYIMSHFEVIDRDPELPNYNLMRKKGDHGSHNHEMAELINGLGVEQFNMGNFKKALYYFTKSLEHDPTYVDAYNNIGFSWANLGQYRKAKECFKKILDIDPKNEKARINLHLLPESR
jgi:tetratricopeptide (TPR) repeat protein